MQTIEPDLTVAEIARRHPKSLPVFARHGLDLCCGGAHSLRTAACKHRLHLESILRELEEAIDTPPPRVPARSE
jgi:iron-sulfur cluster repair protein YtfE (RIC family)